MHVNVIITNKIIESLKKGDIPWKRPWVSGIPTNYVSKKAYSGINPWMLSYDAGEFGYSSKYWLTFNQIKEAGARLKKGSKGSMVIYAGRVDKTEKDDGEEKHYQFLRYYKVFNADCVEGLEIPQGLQGDIPDADKIILEYPIEYKHGGDRAYYSPRQDYIQLPHKQIFTSLDGYYSTVFHEMTHSTGHESRLNRFKSDEPVAFGSESYSKEELVAELGASFLLNHVGREHTNNNSAYIQGWLKKLQNDANLIISASSKAQKAFDLITKA